MTISTIPSLPLGLATAAAALILALGTGIAQTAPGAVVEPPAQSPGAGTQAPGHVGASLSEDQVRELIRANTDAPSLGFLGEPGVNVLALNLALDALTPAAK